MGGDAPLGAQQRVFLDWMRATPALRHPAPLCVAVRISDRLDAGLLHESLTTVVRRHDALRTAFSFEGDRVRATVRHAPLVETDRAVAAGEDMPSRLAAARDLACAARERPFDLADGPLVRALAIEIDRDHHVLVLAIHHLVCDMWSMGVVLRELAITYSALRTGRAARLPAPTQASEVVAWSRARWPANRAWWDKTLASAPAALRSFTGRGRTASLAPRSYAFRVGRDVAGRMRAFARAGRSTPFMVVLAAWADVLARWSGERDLVVMSPVFARSMPGSETAVGCLFSSLLIRIDTAGRTPFPDLVARARAAAVRAFAHQEYPYQEFARPFAHAPCLGYYGGATPVHLPGLRSEAFDLPSHLVDDLEIPGENLGVPQLSLFDQRDGAIPARLAFNSSAFDVPDVERLSREFMRRLETVPPLEGGATDD